VILQRYADAAARLGLPAGRRELFADVARAMTVEGVTI
jgi:hypothetical protein